MNTSLTSDMNNGQAHRVFNHYQSNTGSHVAGTGDDVHQAPAGSASRRDSGRLAPPVSGAPVCHDHAGEAENGDGNVVGVTGQQQNLASKAGRPHSIIDGAGTSVVPASVPSRSYVRRNPFHRAHIRHHHQRVQISLDEEHYRNPWFSFRSKYRVYLAEFLGTLILVLWGEGTQAQVIALRNAPNDYLSIAWGWGVGFMLAISVSSGISGGHINPAVTISLAVFRKFPWRRVPGYIFSQLLGAFVAAAILFGVYYGPLNTAEKGYLAAVLTTAPAGKLEGLISIFFSVFSGAALLMGAIAAFTDTGNNPAAPGLVPLLLGLVMVGIASSFGYQTGFVLNPARDVGPRLLSWAVGAPTQSLWVDNYHYGIWIPTVGTICGALFGNLIYDLCIYGGRDSPLNYNFSKSGRRAHRLRVQAEKDLENGVLPAEDGHHFEERNSDVTLRNEEQEQGGPVGVTTEGKEY
ncbi:BQ5605_C001g00629 [Microbotryum silenes-dioicae]|uniref:BQ5605_C001g00629 protein n=1 Tax=Microbotryum silenes-dioicae TaxID=796604 RepID=A0A2X0M794_9BASI|nr:BQ5605_C001g00629 [Microbotryum silenes-dioicae]